MFRLLHQPARAVQFLDTGGLEGDVLIDVVRVELCCLFLDRAVLPHRFGMASEKIPKGDMAVQFLGILRTYV